MKSHLPVLKIMGLASAMLMSIAFQNCSPVQFSKPENSKVTIEPIHPGDPVDPIDPVTPVDPVDPIRPNELCYEESFNQPAEKVGKLDILFVTDTSGSLDEERAAVADGIDSFVAGLSNDVDYNVAVMLGHGSTSPDSGTLHQAGTEPFVLTKAMGATAVRNGLRAKLTVVKNDPTTDGGEANLYSINKSVTDAAHYALIQNYGFYRPDAALAVVFISDENDICAVFPPGVTQVPDPENEEGPATIRDCSEITPDTVYAALKNKIGQRPLLVNSVVYVPGKPVLASGENEIGYGMLEMTQLSKGLSVYLAGSNAEIAAGLFDIGKLANSQLDLILKHTISKSGTVTSMDVKVDKQPATFTFDIPTREVNLTQPGGATSLVEINYCIEQTDSTNVD